MAASEPKRIGVSFEVKPHAYDPATNPELFEGVVARRVVAFLIDFLILSIPVVFVSMFIFVIGIVTFGLGFFLYGLLWPAMVLWAICYYGMTLGSPSSATIGMRLMDVEMRTYTVDVAAFSQHVAAAGYPQLYAGGTMSNGGAREQKLLEYFVSLDLLRPTASQVVIDVASEWSVFPRVVEKATGARVYRQDLVYPPGICGDRIGGSAANMPVPAEFADMLVLHNAYEHFEGDADTEFVREAWRVLRPGGVVCILPLNLAEKYHIVTDPLVDRDGIVWDPGAAVVEVPMLWHNRFGRFYDLPALDRRVLTPARQAGFEITVYRVTNVRAVHPAAYLQFALLLTKPSQNSPTMHNACGSKPPG